MSRDSSSLLDWTPEQIARGREWVKAWRLAGPDLERIRQDELRRMDIQSAIALLCGPADYRVPPRAPRPTSGLVDMQRWLHKKRAP